jgi:hypothetical protein
METGRTFRSLEEPPNYYGTHVTVALGAILLPVAALVTFTFLDWFVAFLIVLLSLATSGSVFAISAYLGKDDPFWPEAGLVHLLEEKDYLDV